MSAETKQNQMNSSVGQLSAVAAMLQFSSIGRHPPVPASSTVLNFRHREHSLSSCFGKQESLLAELITS